MSVRSRVEPTPVTIAGVYFVLSAVWIFFSDRLLSMVVDDPDRLTLFQTAKGWLFVVGSALLVYGLVARGRRRLAASNRELESTNRRLDRALQQTSILHRILRHNLRNSCNVIEGNTELLADRDSEQSVERDRCLEAIRQQTDRLATITEKTRLLRDVVMEERPPEPVDVAALVHERVEDARERYPAATIETDLPDSQTVEIDPRLHLAFDELLENAVEHSDGTAPTVRVSLWRAADGEVVVEVVDDGPGMPEMERGVLEQGREEPMYHSEGLGLWIARTLVLASDGRIDIEDNDPRGTVVRLTFEE